MLVLLDAVVKSLLHLFSMFLQEKWQKFKIEFDLSMSEKTKVN